MQEKIVKAMTALCIALVVVAVGFVGNQFNGRAAAASTLTFEGVWARAASEGHMSAAYMTVRNSGNAAVDIVAVRSDVAATVEIHETMTEITVVDGKLSQVMRMAEVEAVTVASGAAVELKPGGLHIMLIDLTRDIEEGDEFVLTLQLSTGELIVLDVPVTVGIGGDDHDHQHHDHHDH